MDRYNFIIDVLGSVYGDRNRNHGKCETMSLSVNFFIFKINA